MALALENVDKDGGFVCETASPCQSSSERDLKNLILSPLDSRTTSQYSRSATREREVEKQDEGYDSTGEVSFEFCSFWFLKSLLIVGRSRFSTREPDWVRIHYSCPCRCCKVNLKNPLQLSKRENFFLAKRTQEKQAKSKGFQQKGKTSQRRGQSRFRLSTGCKQFVFHRVLFPTLIFEVWSDVDDWRGRLASPERRRGEETWGGRVGSPTREVAFSSYFIFGSDHVYFRWLCL